jgi:hypothetical protein
VSGTRLTGTLSDGAGTSVAMAVTIPSIAPPATVTLGTSGPVAKIDMQTGGRTVPRALWGVGGAPMPNDFAALSSASYVAALKGLGLPAYRHNWDPSMMTSFWPSLAASPNAGNFARIDPFLRSAPQWMAPGFLHLVTVNFPTWMDITSATDQQLWAELVVDVASHFDQMGCPAQYWSVTNEPATTEAAALGACAHALGQAMRSYNPQYKVGGPSFAWEQPGPEQTFAIAAGAADFGTWHSYWGANTADDIARRAANDVRNARGSFGAAPQLVLEEYNNDGTDYFNPTNTNLVGILNNVDAVIASFLADDRFAAAFLWDIGPDDAYAISMSDGSLRPAAKTLAQLARISGGRLINGELDATWPVDLWVLPMTSGVLIYNMTGQDQLVRVVLTLPQAAPISRWVQAPASLMGAEAIIPVGHDLVIPAGSLVTLVPS